jgi:hypothetical protein
MTRAFEQNWIETKLWQNEKVYIGEHLQVGDFRLLAFSIQANSGEAQIIDRNFGTVDLDNYAISIQDDLLYLSLTWSGAIASNSNLFIHLLDKHGQIIQQHDRLPGTFPIDRHVFQLPSEARQLSLRIGWVNGNGQFIQGDSEDFLLLEAVCCE